ncbi:MAG: hypothetical protein V1688_00835 [bacterium]
MEKIKVDEKGNKNFELNRCKEDRGRNTVYLINHKKKKYHRIADPYTLNAWGFNLKDDVIEKKSQKDSKTDTEYEKKLFSKESEDYKDYTQGKRKKIYNITVDMKEKMELAKLMIKD